MQAHIVRLDTSRNHGYQVRFKNDRKRRSSSGPGYHSRLFSDSIHGGKRKAKKKAEEYLNELLEAEGIEIVSHGRRIGMKYPENPGKTIASNVSGRNGVFRGAHVVTRGRRTQDVAYWGASYSIGPDGNATKRVKRFYIGKARTEREAKRLAIRFREGWEKAFLEGGVRGVKRFFREWHAFSQ